MSAQRQFWIVVAGTLVGIAIWRIGERAVDGVGWPETLGTALAVFIAVNIFEGIRHWIQGRRGLGQWPEPHGRYYAEWMRLPEGAGDYYEWLAGRMGHREPWTTWVQRERALAHKQADHDA